MTRTAIALVLVQVLAGAGLGAHRLDEYLQATRVNVARDRIGIEIDLTPGVNIAPDVFARIDRDGNRVVSGEEAEAYGRQVVADFVLELDARVLSPALTRVEVPSAGEMHEGVGTIRIEASAATGRVNAGRHAIRLRSNHDPGRSVYLVNALMPTEHEISIASQSRDAPQREARIEYDVAAAGAGQASWVLLGLLCVSALFIVRR